VVLCYCCAFGFVYWLNMQLLQQFVLTLSAFRPACVFGLCPTDCSPAVCLFVRPLYTPIVIVLFNVIASIPAPKRRQTDRWTATLHDRNFYFIFCYFLFFFFCAVLIFQQQTPFVLAAKWTSSLAAESWLSWPGKLISY